MFPELQGENHYKTHVHIPGPNRLRAREASRKSQCRERFEVRGILKSKEEQIVGPCLERVELKRKLSVG